MFKPGDTIKVISVKSWNNFTEYKNLKTFVSCKTFLGDLRLVTPSGVIISIVKVEEFEHCRMLLLETNIF